MNKQNKADPELKPCPFCGEEVSISYIEPHLLRPSRNGKYCIPCWNCEYIFGYDLDYGCVYDDKETLARDWNTRKRGKKNRGKQSNSF